jgi:hypothetical protein
MHDVQSKLQKETAKDYLEAMDISPEVHPFVFGKVMSQISSQMELMDVKPGSLSSRDRFVNLLNN